MLSFHYQILKINKLLRYGLCSKGGRNFLGRICVFGRGLLNKRFRYLIDYNRRLCLFGFIVRIFFDKILIALVLYQNGLSCFISITSNVAVGNRIYSGVYSDATLIRQSSWAVTFNNISLFSVLCNVELFPSHGFKIARSPGCFVTLIGRSDKRAFLKLKSGWQISVLDTCLAVLGSVFSLKNYSAISLGSAGKSRSLGFRPKVRGVAKNPCDHPHGGGNGKKSPPVSPVTAWGRFTKGTHTLNKKYNKINRRLYKNVAR